ncbi:MAG: leucyl aminopeptidase family protein [Chitinophagales bacterium]
MQDKTQAVIVPISQENREACLAEIARITDIEVEVLQEDFKANAKEILPLYLNGQSTFKRLYLLGLGKKPNFSIILNAFRSFTHKFKTKLPKDIGISFKYNNESEDPAMTIEAALNGIKLGTYNIGLYRTDEKKTCVLTTEDASISVFSDFEDAQKVGDRVEAIADTQLEIMDLVNGDSNNVCAEYLANWAVESGQKYGFDVTVFDKAQCQTVGLHALLAVNRGSELPPRFIIMEYKPKGFDGEGELKKVGLVGKGITYDTGGLSIKNSQSMPYMKSDMGGASAVLGAMEVAAKLQLQIHLIGIVPSTDNCVDANAIKPGDVISSYSGKTIEVMDTDAEGRLVLADGLAYMKKHYSPDVMIDLATLTGSSVRALGFETGAMFSHNDELAAALAKAGDKVGERVWRMPLWDSYKKMLKSDIADIKNFSEKPVAGAITAAKFLETFTDGHTAWAHLDIAGMIIRHSEYSSQRSATAYGVRLLLEYLEDIV